MGRQRRRQADDGRTHGLSAGRKEGCIDPPGLSSPLRARAMCAPRLNQLPRTRPRSERVHGVVPGPKGLAVDLRRSQPHRRACAYVCAMQKSPAIEAVAQTPPSVSAPVRADDRRIGVVGQSRCRPLRGASNLADAEKFMAHPLGPLRFAARSHRTRLPIGVWIDDADRILRAARVDAPGAESWNVIELPDFGKMPPIPASWPRSTPSTRAATLRQDRSRPSVHAAAPRRSARLRTMPAARPHLTGDSGPVFTPCVPGETPPTSQRMSKRMRGRSRRSSTCAPAPKTSVAPRTQRRQPQAPPNTRSKAGAVCGAAPPSVLSDGVSNGDRILRASRVGSTNRRRGH
jgi:hypothetical protein